MPKGRRRGKSGLHRAGCRITSGRGDSKDSATEIYRLQMQVRLEVRDYRLGGNTQGICKPHPKQDRKEVVWRPVMLQVGRLSLLATAELDR